MKIQLEQIDLLSPWPELTLRPGYHAVRVLAYLGTAPVGEVLCRPARSGKIAPRRLRKRLARRIWLPLLRMLAREGLAAGPDALRPAVDELRNRPCRAIGRRDTLRPWRTKNSVEPRKRRNPRRRRSRKSEQRSAPRRWARCNARGPIVSTSALCASAVKPAAISFRIPAIHPPAAGNSR